MTASYNYATSEYSAYNVERLRFVRQDLGIAGQIAKHFSNKPMTNDPFHIATEVLVSNPLTGEKQIILLEKNETLKAKVGRAGGVPGFQGGPGGLEVDVSGKNLTLGQMNKNVFSYYRDVLEKPIDKYSLACSNCQMFSLNFARASGLDVSGDVEAFVDQNAPALVPGAARPVLNALTDTAAWWSNNITDRFFNKTPAPLRKNNPEAIALALAQE